LGKKRWRKEDQEFSRKILVSFFQRREKLSDILSYNEEHKVGTTRKTIKEEKKKKRKNYCEKKPMEVLLMLREAH
jgi:hypothetical protein